MTVYMLHACRALSELTKDDIGKWLNFQSAFFQDIPTGKVKF